MSKKQRQWFWVLFAAGFILDWAGAFGPVHEFFHWIFTLLSGGYAKILTWTYTGMDQIRLIPLLAGPWGEMFVWIILSFLLLAKGKVLGAGFFWGVFHGCWTGQPFGSDFNVALPEFMYHYYIVILVWVLFALTVSAFGWVAFSPYLIRRRLQAARNQA